MSGFLEKRVDLWEGPVASGGGPGGTSGEVWEIAKLNKIGALFWYRRKGVLPQRCSAHFWRILDAILTHFWRILDVPLFPIKQDPFWRISDAFLTHFWRILAVANAFSETPFGRYRLFSRVCKTSAKIGQNRRKSDKIGVTPVRCPLLGDPETGPTALRGKWHSERGSERVLGDLWEVTNSPIKLRGPLRGPRRSSRKSCQKPECALLGCQQISEKCHKSK